MIDLTSAAAFGLWKAGSAGELLLQAGDRLCVVGVGVHRGGQAQVREGLLRLVGAFEGATEEEAGVVVARVLLKQRGQRGGGSAELGRVEVRARGQELDAVVIGVLAEQWL